MSVNPKIAQLGLVGFLHTKPQFPVASFLVDSTTYEVLKSHFLTWCPSMRKDGIERSFLHPDNVDVET